ncbi:hypothetical protein WR25_09473 [Diploscapter pachys]|uniref:Uncharacterized protein n=1 Tax=Diploscapter pachys TaxID=2018661 RepID=A0A2A2K7T8_9BILA|nr:hypothetical protein WR25_09473 [Diploscapter pachys]
MAQRLSLAQLTVRVQTFDLGQPGRQGLEHFIGQHMPFDLHLAHGKAADKGVAGRRGVHRLHPWGREVPAAAGVDQQGTIAAKGDDHLPRPQLA